MRDLLGWLLALPVILIYLDPDERVIRWRFCSLSEVLLLLGFRGGND
jgi:hypothetical protein